MSFSKLVAIKNNYKFKPNDICVDTPGVIGKIGDLFGKNGVSIESIVQLDATENKAEIVVITHEVSNGKFEKSKKEINALSEVELIASQLSCI